jgi:hypothetical protein
LTVSPDSLDRAVPARYQRPQARGAGRCRFRERRDGFRGDSGALEVSDMPKSAA